MERVTDTDSLLPADLYTAVVEKELGQTVRSSALMKLTKQYDGQLHSFVIRMITASGVFFLRKNVDHSMAQVFANHQIMSANMPAGTVPKTAVYVPDIQAVLTSEIRSQEFMSQTARTKEKLLLSAGRLLRRIHQLPPKIIRQVRGRPNTLEELLQTVNHRTLLQIKKINPEMYYQLREPLSRIERYEKEINRLGPRRIIVGDFHPLNILNHNGRAALVDLDDLAVGSPWRDVGSMLEQLHSILHYHEPRTRLPRIKRYQEIFLKGYGSSTVASLPPVIFYQAWIAWRNALYFASRYQPNFTKAEISLHRCHSFLNQCKP